MVAAVLPTSVARAGGTPLVVSGASLGGVTEVRVGGVLAAFSAESDGQLLVTAPVGAGGPADVQVTDASGLTATLPMAVLYLDDLSGAAPSLGPDHGPVDGGTRVTVTTTAAAIGPGTSVQIGGRAAVDVDVVDLHTLRFTTPMADVAGLQPLTVTRPDGQSAVVGAFSYDLPVGAKIDLPGFPPREISDAALVGNTLYVGVPTGGYEGLEIFDVGIEEHPIWLGGVRTAAPVRGVAVSGGLALLAADTLGLYAVDVSDPGAPFALGRASTTGRAVAVRLEDGIAWVATADSSAGNGWIQRFDARVPGLPTVLPTFGLPGDAVAMDLGPDRVYALTSSITGEVGSGLWLTILDRAGNLRSSTRIVDGTWSLDALLRSRLAVRGGRAFVTFGTRLWVYDLGAAGGPTAIQSADFGYQATGLTWMGASLYVATWSSSATSGGAANASLTLVPPTKLLALDVSPADGAVAAPATAVAITFTKPISPDSVTATSFQVRIEAGDGSLTPVEGQREAVFAVRGSSIVFTPTQPFMPGQVVRVDVAGIRGFGATDWAQELHTSFTVLDPEARQPRIDGVTPSAGFIDATTEILIEGSGFREGDVVRVGPIAAQVLSVTPTAIRAAVLPQLAVAQGLEPIRPGSAAVEVEDPSSALVGGVARHLVDRRVGGFRFFDHLRLNAVVPAESPQRGGVDVALQGYGFAPGMKIAFGDAPSWSVRVLSMEAAVATAPPHDAGKVDVVAETPQSAATGFMPAQRYALPLSFTYGAGALARLATLPVRHVIVDGGIAYAALGGTVDVLDGTTGLPLEPGVAAAEGGLLIADVTEPTRLTKASVNEKAKLTFAAAGGASRLAKDGPTIYLAAGAAGVKIYDVSLPAAPVERSGLSTQGPAVDVAVSGDLLFVADAAGVTEYRLGETTKPMKLRQVPYAGGASALLVHRGQLLVATGGQTGAKLRVLDARRGDLREIGAMDLIGPAVHLAAEGDRVFAALGKLEQVTIARLTGADPISAGVLLPARPLAAVPVIAQETTVAGGIAYVACGGGDVQRFAVPVIGDATVRHPVERTIVLGDAYSLAFMGRYLMVGTLFLNNGGAALELPVYQADQARLPLAGAVESIALDHLHLRGSSPGEGELAALGEPLTVAFTDLPDPGTVGGVTVESDDLEGAPLPVSRRVATDPAGGKLLLSGPLLPDRAYRLRIGRDVADLQGGRLGEEAVVRFRTALDATEARPRVDRVFPAHGLAAGGEVVDVLGSGFLPGAAVRVGGEAATLLSVAPDGTRLRVRLPAGALGAAGVDVANPSGLAGSRLGAYRYLVAPRITSFSPASAPYGSRAQVQITGDGLFGGTQVTFGGVPAVEASLDSDGVLWATTPDGVIGGVDLAVTTPTPAGGVMDVRPGGFTFTLSRTAAVQRRTWDVAPVGSVVLALHDDTLSAYDLSVPTTPALLREVPSVSYYGKLAVSGRTAYVAGSGQVVRYDLGTCGAQAFADCPIVEIDRATIDPLNTSTTALAAAGQGAYATLADGPEISLVGMVNGALEVVAQAYLASGKVRALAASGDALVVLVQDGASSRVELRDLADGHLDLVASYGGLPAAAHALSVEGGRIAVAAGRKAVLLARDESPTAGTYLYEVGTWSSPEPSDVSGIDLAGPWLLASNGSATWLVDTTAGSTFVGRTWATTGSGPSPRLAGGVALVGDWSRLGVYEVPYPTVSEATPLPHGAVAPGAPISITISPRLPLTVAAGSRIDVDDGAGPVAGSSTRDGASVRFTPAGALIVGHGYEVTASIGPAPAVGGTLLGPWRYPVRGGVAAPGLAPAAVAPGSGAIAGGGRVVISGTGLADVARVWFGEQPVTPASATATRVEADVPASPWPGPVRVQVEDALGARADVPGGYVYVAPLAIVSVDPAEVGTGERWVTVHGTGFTRGAVARFDGALTKTQAFALGGALDGFQALLPASEVLGPVALTVEVAGQSVTRQAAVIRKDLSPPSVQHWYGIDALTYVGTQPTFHVVFNEPIAAASLGAVRLSRTTPSATEPIGAPTLDPDGRGFTVAPQGRLGSYTEYVLSVVGVTDLAGNAVPQGLAGSTRTFRTVDEVKPSAEIWAAGRRLATGDFVSVSNDWALDVVGVDDVRQISASATSLWVDCTAAATLADPSSTRYCTPVQRSGADNKFHKSWATADAGRTSTLWARVSDGVNDGDVLVTIQLTDNMPPTCGFTAPAGNAVTMGEGSTLTLTGWASDATVYVKSLELRVDGVVLIRSPGTAINQTLNVTTGWRIPAPRAAPYLVTLHGEDDKGVPCDAGPVAVTATGDVTPPALAWQAPFEGARIAAQSATSLAVSATDENGVAEVVYSADGVEIARLVSPPWTTTWLAPSVSVATPVTLTAVATDRAGKAATATRSVTVEPAAALPLVAFAAPAANANVVEGSSFAATLVVSGPSRIARVRLTFEGQETVLTAAPWRAVLVAPAVSGAARVAQLRAVAVDEGGREGAPATVSINVTEDGLAAPTAALAMTPTGPVLVGGSALRVDAASEATSTGSVAVDVGGALLGTAGLGGTWFQLPAGPEAAEVRARAEVQSPASGSGSAQASGTLAVFAEGEAAVRFDVPYGVTVTGLAVRGDDVLIAVDRAGGAGRVERRRRADGAVEAIFDLAGTPTGVAFAGDRAVVAVSRAGRGSLELLALADLAQAGAVPLVRAPRALAAFGGGVAVGTDEGIELRDGAGTLLAQVPVGSVRDLSSSGGTVAALTPGTLHVIDGATPWSPAASSVPAPGATAVAAMADGRACAVGPSVQCWALDAQGVLRAAGETSRRVGPQADAFDAGLDGTLWTRTEVGGSTNTVEPAAVAGALQVTGRGTDLTGTSDQFTWVTQAPAAGDFTVDVRVLDAPSGASTKAGLMVRGAPLAANGPYFSMLWGWRSPMATHRLTAGAGPTSTAVGGLGAAPGWLRIVRTGTTFRGYASLDGATWTLVKSQSIPALAGALQVGLAVTSGSTSAGATATFDDFAVSAPGARSAPPAVNAVGLGPWLVVGTPERLEVFDARAAGQPAMAGVFPAMGGRSAASAGALYAADAGSFARLGLARGPAAPVVTLGLPATAPRGARVALGATVDDGLDPLGAYTAEVLVDGRVVQVSDSTVPAAVDLPATGDAAAVTLRVRDLAGQVASRTAQVTLTAPAGGPAIRALVVPGLVAEGAAFRAAALVDEPARVARVELAYVGDSGRVTALAPALAAELVAPMVTADPVVGTVAVTVVATAYDVDGRAGPPLEQSLLVRDDAVPAAPAVTSLTRVGSGAIVEGSLQSYAAAVLPGGAPIREVQFRVSGQLEATVGAPPWQAALRMPLVTGSGSSSLLASIEARAIDLDGRASAWAAASASIVLDTAGPVPSLSVVPEGTAIAAGATLVATGSATDAGAVDGIVIQARLILPGLAPEQQPAPVLGGATLAFTVPEGTAPGARVDVTATFTDRSGNRSTASATRWVVGPALPAPAPAAVGPFAGAARVAVLGEHAYVATSHGLEIARLVRGAAPALQPLRSLGGGAALDVAVVGDTAVVVRADRLQFLDVSDPAAPSLRAERSGGYSRAFVGGGQVYVRSLTGTGFAAIDLTDPAFPVIGAETATMPLAGTPAGLAYVNATATSVTVDHFRADGSVASPVIDTSRVARAAELDGDVLLVAAGTDVQVWLWVDNRYNTATFYKVATVPLPAGVHALAAGDRLAYLACDDGNLRVLDFAEPRSARVVASTPLAATSVVLSGGTLVAAAAEGVRVLPVPGRGTALDPTAPLAPSSVVALTGDYPVGVGTFRGSLYVAQARQGGKRIDAASAEPPALAGPDVSAPSGVTTDIGQVQRTGSLLLYLNRGASSRLYVSGEATTPALAFSGNGLSTQTTNLGALGVADRFSATAARLWKLGGGILTTADLPAVTGAKSLSVIPTVGGGNGSVTDVSGDDARAVVARGSAGLALVGFDQAGDLRILGSASEYPVTSVAMEGDVAVAASGTRLVVYDLTDATAPVAVGVGDVGGYLARVRLHGRLALAAVSGAGAELWDVSTPRAPVRLARLDSKQASLGVGNAVDAAVVGSRVLVADGAQVAVFPLPAGATPAVRVTSPAEGATVVAGQLVDIGLAAAGSNLDDVELLVNGRPYARLDDLASRARWRVPLVAENAIMELRIRGRGTGGRVVESPPRRVRAVAATNTQLALGAPTLTPAGASQRSGTSLQVRACASPATSTGVGPFTGLVRFGSSVLGPVAQDPADAKCFLGQVRLPVLASNTAAPLVMEVTDALGRTSTASVASYTVSADATSPAAATGLPTSLRAAPFVNAFTVSETDVDGLLVLRVHLVRLATGERTLLGTSPEGPSASVPVTLTIPASQIGESFQVEAVGTDTAGHVRTTTSATLVLKPDGDPPVVAAPTISPSSYLYEHAQVTLAATATDSADGACNLATLSLFANGELVGTYPGPGVNPPSLCSWSLSVPTRAPATPAGGGDGVLQVYAVATDTAGRTTTSSTTSVTVFADATPPQTSVTITPSDTPLFVGSTVQVCGRAIDSAEVSTARLAINGVEIASPARTACYTSQWGYAGGHCYDVCATHLVDGVGDVSVEFVATDPKGQVGSLSRTYPAVVNQPPVFRSVVTPAYAIAGRSIPVSWTVEDERAYLKSMVVTVDGAATGTSSTAKVSSASITLATAGDHAVSLVATDTGNLASSQSVTVPTWPAGTSLQCASPLPLDLEGPTRVLLQGLATPLAGCGSYYGLGTGAWVSLPFDGPVERATIEVTGGTVYVTAPTGTCGPLPGSCGMNTTTIADAQAHAPVFIGRHPYCSYYADGCGADLSVQVTSAVLGVGTSCDPASTAFVCGLACRQGQDGGFRCAAPACSDGVNSDGDEDDLADYPADPGCSSPDDDDETDPAAMPACADGNDNDGDGPWDFPDDPGCQAAASDGEDFCETPLAGVLTGRQVPFIVSGTTAGGPDRKQPTCGPAGAPEAVYEFRAPVSGVYGFSASPEYGFTVAVRVGEGTPGAGPTCDGRELSCGDGVARAYLASGQLAAIIVDGGGAAGGAFELSVAMESVLLAAGDACDPWLFSSDVCERGTVCRDDGAGAWACSRTACANGADDDAFQGFDWPEDPGCAAPEDDDESATGLALACSNGRDDDGDDLTDWPQDRACHSAAGGSEAWCEATPAAGNLTGLPMPFALPGSNLGAESSASSACGGAGLPDRVYEFTATHTGVYEFWVEASYDALLSVRDGGCGGGELVCAAGGTVAVGLTAGRSVAIAVDAVDAARPYGQFILHGGLRERELADGEACDPASITETCGYGRCLDDGTGQARCVAPACSTAEDEDGDGLPGYPTDPGCAWPGDDDETDPVVASGCTNGRDDDQDGATDRLDPQCWSASGSEAFCPVRSDGTLTGLPLDVRVRGSTTGREDRFRAQDGAGAGTPDVVYEWTAPYTGTYEFRVDGLNFPAQLTVRETTCDGVELQSSSAPFMLMLGAGETFALVVDGRWSNVAEMEQLPREGVFDLAIALRYAELPTGAACDPLSTTRVCAKNGCALDLDGAFRCSAAGPACADGQDNDGDHLVDWPFDPGCAWPGDDDETDPATPPACTDAADRDGDGEPAFPGDPQCGAAAGDSESFCAAPIAGVLSTLPLPIHVEGSLIGGTTDLVAGCAGNGYPARVYEYTPPARGYYRFDLSGTTTPVAIAVRDGSCTGSGEYCAASAYSTSTPPEAFELLLEAGRTKAVIIQASGPIQGRYALHVTPSPTQLVFGQACVAGATTCEPGTTCRVDAEGQDRCLGDVCGDLQDNDWDGRADFPDDPGCSSWSDTTENDPDVAPTCLNGIDDDGDGWTDWPDDPKCTSASASELFCAPAPLADLSGPSSFPIAVSGSTAGRANAYGSTCGGGAGSGDVSYRFVPGVSGTYRIDTVGSSYDTVLHVHRLACGGALLACNDDSSGTLQSLVDVALQAGEPIAIIVDGYGSSSTGSYVLHVRPLSEAGYCTGGGDEDGDQLVDCADPDCAAYPICTGAGPTSSPAPRRGPRRRRRQRTEKR